MTHNVYKGKEVVEKGDSEQLSVPLDDAILRTLSASEKDKLVNRAMQVTILHRKRVKEKWYEKGVFKVALAIVSISVAAFTSGLGLSLMTTLQAVATSIAISVAIDVAIGVLVDVAIKLGISPELVAVIACLLYTSPSPRDGLLSRMPSSA